VSIDGRTFATPARVRLAAVTRHLVDAVLTTEDAPDEDLATAADAIERSVAILRGRAVDAAARPDGKRPQRASRHDRAPHRPVPQADAAARGGAV